MKNCTADFDSAKDEMINSNAYCDSAQDEIITDLRFPTLQKI